MRQFEELTAQGQLRRLRQVAAKALAEYGLEGAELRFVQHGENTTYRVDAPGAAPAQANGSIYEPGRYLLRLHGVDYHTRAEIESEQLWLHSLRADLGLAVPEPLPSGAGGFTTVVEQEGMAPRVCTVMRWLRGRHVEERFGPRHIVQVGRLLAALHRHAAAWTPPPQFTRRRWDWEGLLGDAGGFGVPAQQAWSMVSQELRGRCEQVGERLRAAMGALGEGRDAFGLIHADLHEGNLLFADSMARAIDFDDSGYGYWLYDLVVPLSDWRLRPEWPEMCEALLNGYREGAGPLPAEQLAHLDIFFAARRVSLLLWVLGRSVSDPSFRPYIEGQHTRTADLLDALGM